MNLEFISGNKGKSEQTSVVGRDVNYRQVLKEDGVLYEPQSLFFPGKVTILNHLRKQLSDVAISKIEGLIALYSALSEVRTYRGFLGVLTLYIKTHSSESIMSQLQNIVTALFSDMRPQDSSRPKWLDDMSLALTDWKLLLNSPSFSKVSRVLSLLVTLGIMERKSVNLGNFEIFAIEAQNKQSNAIDLVDALIETVVFFAEGAYQCFLTGSIKPLLFSSSEVIQLEEAYIKKVEEWEYVRNGNLERFTSKTEAMFDKELDEILDKLHNMYKTMPSGVEKKIVQQKWEALSKIRTEFIAVRVSGGLRKAPYCVKVYGDSGVGKSTFADITMVTVLKAMGLPSTSDYVCTLNEADKYMSTYRSYITGIKMDDYGNTKMDFWETSPSDWIIKICNNIREYAVMADIANKGKITIEPGCLTITTNVEDMHASKCSYNAMSILRRAHTHVELNVRPEFLTDNMLDSYKVLQKFGSLDKVNDIWLITIKKPIGSSENSQIFAGWDIVKKDISIYEYMSYLVEKVKIHNAAQISIVDSFKEPSDIVHFCERCAKCSHDCECELDPQFGDRIAKVISDKVSSAKLDFSLKKLSFETKVEDLAVDYMLKACNDFWKSPYAYWTSWMPDSIMSHPYAKAFVLWTGSSVLEDDIKTARRGIIGQYILGCVFWFLISPMAFFLYIIIGGCYVMTLLSNLEVAKQNAYLDEICKRRGSLHKAFISAREKHVHYACGIFAGLAVLYGVVQVVKALKDSINIQGMLAPKSVEDIRNRDKEVNPWSNDAKVLPKIVQTFSGDDAGINAMKKVVAQIEIGNNFSNALMLKTHIVMFPLHLLPTTVVEAKILYAGRKIRFVLNPDLCYVLPNKDAVVAYVPNSGSFKDITGFFMETPCKIPMTCKMVGLKTDNTYFTSDLFWQHVDSIHNGFTAFAGSHYVLNGMNTFNGMCMSPILTQNGKCTIVGVHIGGVADTPRGCGMSLTKLEVDKAISILYTKSSTFIPGPQANEIDDVVFGKKIAISPEVHRKCPSNFITGDCDIEVYGSVIGRSTYHSDVIETPISSLVEEVCGIPNKWGPPKFVNPEVRADGKVDSGVWKPWFASLEVCSKPSIGFDPKEVDKAIDDYLAELIDCFTSQFEVWKKDLRPLTDIEIVSGMDGRRFIDSMPSGTSMGYPINGPKRNHLIDLEPTDEHACPRTFTKEIWDEVDKLYALADKDMSLNQIFGASLKDEPTSISKDKVRVFQAAPVALQVLVRKYFLPIGRFLSMNPLVAECAVGINAFGPEWNELSEHMAKFGDDRIIAGDYSKYDLRMPAQLTLSAFSVMIRIAILSGNYSKQDIKRMFVIAHEVCTPLIAYNGTLMRFLGTNPSGQNMTVYVNSIVNSLLHRLAFQSVYSQDELKKIGEKLQLGRVARFRDLVALATYGDDAKGSVREGYDKFNHVSMADYLEANDMKFTMPDKESDPIPFMNRYRADFLKRTDRFDENLGVYVGMLNETSIFKSLHAILKSKIVSPRDVSAMNIEGALREWFFHGEEKFEMRRSQMKEIAQRAGLIVRDLDKDYQARVEEWKDKYVPQSGCHINEAEDALKLKVKMTLGTPTICDEPILIPNLGRPDMVYVHPKFIMAIETKVLKGKTSNYKKVVYQATKYATAIHILRPDATVVGMIYTENGFEVVKHFGDYKCPKQYVKVLDASLYNNDAFLG